MKKLNLLSLLALAISCVSYAQTLEPGTTTALWKSPTAADYRQAKTDGVRWVEVALNQCYRGVPPEQVVTRIEQMAATIDSADIRVWSIHLPFSRTLDISVLDDSLRNANVQFMSEMILQSARFHPSKLVLHPSSEPIPDSLREARLGHAIRSVGILKAYAARIGAQLCIENLPRTCLGNTPEELMRIIEPHPEVGICFDTNHYVDAVRGGGATTHFMEVAASRVATIHASDYDYVNECHWLPTQGMIDWSKFMTQLHEAGYTGVFMYEAMKDHLAGDVRLRADQIASSFEVINRKK